MKKLVLAAWIAFALLTFVGIGFVLFKQFNSVIVIVPMVFAVSFGALYHRKYKAKD